MNAEVWLLLKISHNFSRVTVHADSLVNCFLPEISREPEEPDSAFEATQYFFEDITPETSVGKHWRYIRIKNVFINPVPELKWRWDQLLCFIFIPKKNQTPSVVQVAMAA